MASIYSKLDKRVIVEATALAIILDMDLVFDRYNDPSYNIYYKSSTQKKSK